MLIIGTESSDSKPPTRIISNLSTLTNPPPYLNESVGDLFCQNEFFIDKRMRVYYNVINDLKS